MKKNKNMIWILGAVALVAAGAFVWSQSAGAVPEEDDAYPYTPALPSSGSSSGTGGGFSALYPGTRPGGLISPIQDLINGAPLFGGGGGSTDFGVDFSRNLGGSGSTDFGVNLGGYNTGVVGPILQAGQDVMPSPGSGGFSAGYKPGLLTIGN